MYKALIPLALAASFAATPVLAEDALVVSVKRLSLDVAVKLAQGTIAACREKGIQIGVKPEPGVEYTIEFVGTRKDFQRDHQPHYNSAGEKLRLTHRYSDDIGTVLQSSKGTGARYKFVGDELFVRARIISTKAQRNPIHDGDLETAWTQPLSPKP